jgi:hypothetical protein
MAGNRRDDFHLAEYKALREEILLTIKNQYDMQRAVAIFVAVVYGFAFQIEGANKPLSTSLVAFLWTVPFLVALVAYRANVYTDESLLIMSDYIRNNIEFGFASQIGGKKAGWETYLLDIRKNESVISIPHIYWVGMLSATFGMAIYKFGYILFVK